nr:MAG TPA: hypothetical protein [Caudoviricetes sp.]
MNHIDFSAIFCALNISNIHQTFQNCKSFVKLFKYFKI